MTLDLGLRFYKWNHPLSNTGEASAFTFERFDPAWGGKPPVLFEPVLVGGARRARNPLTGEILPSPFIGQMVPGSGYTCDVILPETPCTINGIVTQRDGNYVSSDEGFVEPLATPVRPALRHGVRAEREDGHSCVSRRVPRRHRRVRSSRAGRRSGSIGSIRYTNFASYMTGTGTTTPVSVSGAERENAKRPVSYKYTIGFQRELGWNVVMDLAYVGDTTHNLGQDINYNPIPAGARFLPENRDLSVPDSATVGLQPEKPNPGALPDVFLRPIRGFGDINISEPIGKSWYDSMQLQLSRRFSGGFELSGAYTWAKRVGYRVPREQPGSVGQQPQPRHPGARRGRQLSGRDPQRFQRREMGAGEMDPRQLAPLGNQHLRDRGLVEHQRQSYRQLRLLRRWRHLRQFHHDRRSEPAEG